MQGNRKCAECSKIYSLIHKHGMSKYCGADCIKKVRDRTQQTNRNRRKEKSLVDINYKAKLIFDRYRVRAPKRGLVFELTVEQFIQGIMQPCYYCNEDYDSIGFDRLDSDIGYTTENSVSCCTMCNMMKRKYNLNDFINKCKEISANFA
jgi:hypothetical protein